MSTKPQICTRDPNSMLYGVAPWQIHACRHPAARPLGRSPPSEAPPPSLLSFPDCDNIVNWHPSSSCIEWPVTCRYCYGSEGPFLVRLGFCRCFSFAVRPLRPEIRSPISTLTSATESCLYSFRLKGLYMRSSLHNPLYIVKLRSPNPRSNRPQLEGLCSPPGVPSTT
jgi:hypothetical protein